ncbi:MAG: ATP-dependent RecD-like DNA helicase [Polyangiaceae bacterium]|nr:ATP-dependent RecD-like DNA helicase [Polyangiaceae bacterium]
MPVTLTGEIERVTFENHETGFRVYRVGRLEGEGAKPGALAVVGTLPALGQGTRVRVSGELVTDARFGEQLRADALVPLVPETLDGLERYLASGVLPGVGEKLARSIVQAFGAETLGVLDDDPDRLAFIRGIGSKKLPAIRRAWRDSRALSNVMLALQAAGASPALAARIHRHYGDRAVAVVQQTPYRLALEVRGVGFGTADRLARALGLSMDHPERVQAGTLHELGELAEQGHVAVPRPLLLERAATRLEVDAAHVESAVDALRASERVVEEEDTLYLARLHAAEVVVARALRRLVDAPARALPGLAAAIERFETERGLVLAPGQRQAVVAAAERKVVVVTGGPGVGKTTIVRAIVDVLERGRLSVALAAPTGRAAKRLAESTGRDASTLHRLLEFEPRTATFQRHHDAPLGVDAVIVDEASMIDISLASALLDALAPATRLVVVGDADQLPSVGPGAFLRDVIASDAVPVVRLGTIFRQAEASRIVLNAHRILGGELPASASADDPAADFFVIPRRDPDEAARTVRELVAERIPRRFGLDPTREVQVLVPMHRGALGTVALNALLQEALNPGGARLANRGGTFRVGDRVLQNRNDYERDVYNGDLGVVCAANAADRQVVVRFDDREVRYEESDLEALQLAYATSIHKSQGSEYRAVVVALSTSHYVMLERNLLYTAVTRARQLCVLVADPRALRLALDATRRDERRTRLVERLRAPA